MATLAPVGKEGSLNGTTAVDVVDLPATGHQRTVRNVKGTNLDTIAHTVVLYKNKAATLIEVWRELVQAGEPWCCDDVIVLDNNGCAPSNPVCPVAGTNFVANGGAGRTWGVEAELVSRFAFLGGEMTGRVSASRQEGRFTSGLYDGLEVPQTSDWSAAANLNYRRPLGGGLSLFGNLNYAGQWGGVQEVIQPIYRLQDRGVVDLRLGLDLGRWQAAAFARNLFDESYYLLRMPGGRRWADRRSVGFQFRYAS